MVAGEGEARAMGLEEEAQDWGVAWAAERAWEAGGWAAVRAAMAGAAGLVAGLAARAAGWGTEGWGAAKAAWEACRGMISERWGCQGATPKHDCGPSSASQGSTLCPVPEQLTVWAARVAVQGWAAAEMEKVAALVAAVVDCRASTGARAGPVSARPDSTPCCEFGKCWLSISGGRLC